MINYKNSNLEQCDNCKGVGLVKYHAIICQICEGKKCIQCNSRGISKMPYDECLKCEGTGTCLK